MTLQDFISFTSQAQLFVVSDQGKRVHQHVSMEHTITLYRIEDFFVQVFFDRRELRITQLRAFPAQALSHYYHEEAEMILAEEHPAGAKVADDRQGDSGPAEGKTHFFAWKPGHDTRQNKGNKQ